MNFLWMIINYGKDDGVDFCIEALLKPNLRYFDYDYEFGPLGKIIKQTKRNITDSTKKEAERYFRIAIQSVRDYHEKENRNEKFIITEEEQNEIWSIINRLKFRDYISIKASLVELVKQHENRVLTEMAKSLKIEN